MCWSCNPYCGGCKPPKPKPIKCPKCKSYCFPELLKCNKCGTILPELPKPEPGMCLSIGKICATPCGKHKKAPLDGVENICNWHVEPDTDRKPD